MRDRLLRTPRWVLSLVLGLYFAAFMALWSHYGGHHSWSGSLLGAALGGVLFGWFMGRFAARQYAVTREARESVPEGKRRAVSRATWRGPIPEDPEIRAAAHRLAVGMRSLTWLTPLRSAVAGVVFLALDVWLAVRSESVGYWLAGVFIAVMFGGSALYQRRMQRRIEQLRPDTPPTPPAG